MKADFSRLTFDEKKHYRAVLMQQGRVQVDADWNEQQAIYQHRIGTETADTIGPYGAPEAGGFRLKFSTSLNAIAVVNPGEGGLQGWGVGDGAMILHREGAKWTLQNAPRGTKANLLGVHFLDEKTGWAVGQRGTILFTENGGEEWRAQKAKSEAALRAVHFIRDGGKVLGSAVGEKGTLLLTADGGKEWLVAKTGIKAALNAVYIIPSKEGILSGWAVGAHSTIVQFFWPEDKKEPKITIKAPPAGVTADLYSVGVKIDEKKHLGYAVGDQGTVLSFKDGGYEWEKQETGGPYPLRAVHIIPVDSETDFIRAVSEDGTVLMGQGGKWYFLNTGLAVRLRGIAAATDPLMKGQLWGLGSDGSIFLFGDTGWEKIAAVITDLRFAPGRIYVDGILCELDDPAFFPGPPSFPGGKHLLYLDVWERHMTSLEDQGIRETALGGPDTCTRVQTIGQIKFFPVSSTDDPCKMVAPKTGSLKAWAKKTASSGNACLMSPEGGFRGLENQLYRVEIHGASGSPKGPTFKWSRDNGSIAFPFEVESTGDQKTVVKLLLQDLASRYPVSKEEWIDTWVEIVNDESELTNSGGLLFQVADVPSASELTLAGTFDAGKWADKAKHPIVRRWDHRPDTAIYKEVKPGQLDPNPQKVPLVDGAVGLQEGTWIELESGVLVWFEKGGTYNPGDYWLIPARTGTEDVEWPTQNGIPVARPPLGIQHHYAPLAVISVEETGKNQWMITALEDCQKTFPSLASHSLHVLATNWVNDRLIRLEDPTAGQIFYALGLQIILDEEPDPWTVNPSSMIVSLEMANGLALNLNGKIEVEKNIIYWHLLLPGTGKIASNYAQILSNELKIFAAALKSEVPVRVQVRLKGGLIWRTCGGQQFYLDGQAFGRVRYEEDAEKKRTAKCDLIFPTGAGARGSDFESWFYLSAAAPAPLQVKKVRFLSATGNLSSAGEINPPPVPQDVHFKAGEHIDRIEITFGRPVDVPGASGKQGVWVDFKVSVDYQIIPGNIEVKGDVVTFSSATPEGFAKGFPYRLVILGDAAGERNAVTAQDDNSRLDGDYDGQPGGNFVLPFSAT